MKIYTRRILAITAAALLTACASDTKLTTDWKSPQAANAQLQKVAVFVIAKNDALHRYAEDQMVEKMPKGVGVTGYSMFNKPEQNVELVKKQLMEKGFDGVMVTRLVDIDKTSKYVPPRTYVEHMPTYGGYYGPYGYYGNFGGYYGNAFGATYVTTTPGYEKKQTNVVIETMLYRLPDGALMWSGTTETLNPEVKSEIVDGVVDIVERKINQQGLLKGN